MSIQNFFGTVLMTGMTFVLNSFRNDTVSSHFGREIKTSPIETLREIENEMGNLDKFGDS